jgi:hypothetical protein
MISLLPSKAQTCRILQQYISLCVSSDGRASQYFIDVNFISFMSYKSLKYIKVIMSSLARSSIVGSGTMLQSCKVAGPIPSEAIGFFNLPNPSSRTMALGCTQLLTEMSTRNLTGYKGWPASKADNLTAINEPIV